MTQYSAPKANYLKQAFWWCAGGDPILLKKGTYSDQVKMACMGGTVFSTAVLAFVSGTYAIHTVFSEEVSAAITLNEYLFGIVWGIIIFNIDRFIVSSTPPNIGRTARSKIFSAMPRIMMGLIISLIISKPLELKIFEKDINKKIIEDRELQIGKVREGNKERNKIALAQNNIKLTELKSKRDNLSLLWEDSDKQYKEEARIITVGPRARAMKQDRDEKLQQIKTLENEEIRPLEALINGILENNKQVSKDQEKTIDLGQGSLVNKIIISHEISPLISWMITILFIVLELTPIIFKLLMEEAPYDHQLTGRNDIIKFRSLSEKKESESQITIQLESDRSLFDKIKDEKEAIKLKLARIENDMLWRKGLSNFNIEDEKKTIMKLDEIDQIAEQKMDLELNSYKREINVKTLKQVADKSAEAFLKQEEAKIANSEDSNYRKNVQNILPTSKNAQGKDKKIINSINSKQDAFKAGKFWEPGENYANTYILTKEDIKNKINSEDENLINRLHENDINKTITDLKITHSRKNQNLLEWMMKNDNISRFELDKAKIENTYYETLDKINQSQHPPLTA